MARSRGETVAVEAGQELCILGWMRAWMDGKEAKKTGVRHWELRRTKSRGSNRGGMVRGPVGDEIRGLHIGLAGMYADAREKGPPVRDRSKIADR